ncbi:MAG: mechanosensitive ion channel family protein [Balneolaceae bacterium]|nr:MAG: mechanosensitive ion channel family protein [Balneolaceae bacterium]
MQFTEIINPELMADIIRALVVIIIVFPLLIFMRRWLRKVSSRHYGEHYGMLIGKIFYYIGVVILLISILVEFGLSLTPILGVGGILGIALGFASQTSVSNVISGFFLIAEKSFEVGDVITIQDTTGVVYSIDTLSVKIRMFDNRYVRIPNEMMLKSQVINITRFPIRRLEFRISVAYKEDMTRVHDILVDLANKNPVALQEPAPLIIFDSFGSSSIDFAFHVWSEKSEFLKLRNTLYFDIKKRFDEEGIEIPFPHVSLYAGSATDPFPVMVMNKEEMQVLSPAPKD